MRVLWRCSGGVYTPLYGMLTRIVIVPGLNQMRGEAWTANRKLCVSLLKDLGFAKTATEGRMMEEFRHVAESVAHTNGKPVNTLQYVAPCVFNNVVSFFYGDQLKHDNWTVRKLHRLMVQLVGALFRGRVQHYLPWRLRRLLVRIPFTQSHEVADMLAELDAVSAKQVQQSKAAKSGDDTKGFIHGYIKKIEESRDESVPLITDGYLVGNVNVFLMGGTITLTATLMWHMLNFARNPDTVQARVQREIDEVVGDQRLPTWEDRKQMPYTVACIWELFRWRTVAPLGVSRACAADVVVGDFFIPKDAILLANIWAVHNDPTLWREPNKFMPERHLDEEGRLVSQKPEYVLPFAIGRRDCPGQTFATMEIFFLITFLLQKYRIVPEHPIELDLDSPGTPLSYANNVKLRFLPRKSSKD
ncbi:hypothetical protein HPB50_018707 [Hyalomma asiaticum]|uniref:Uncharacterized protein n=1 Tax=Hyalomma asiaticum TaxID=266040 RepID=A0ACB7RU37_HYAAI|nr:hypothetical protein HPB50_018707 [Hyalomma asiaticum]